MIAKDRKGKENDLIQFFEGNIPNGFKNDFDESLFNSQTHRAIQSSHKWYSFHLLRKDKKRVIASIHFSIAKSIACSPVGAPFGSFEMSDSVTTEQLFGFVQFIESRLIHYGARRISIKCAPEEYHVSHHNILSVILFNHQYQIANAELGACLLISNAPFDEVIDGWERRKLKQSLRAKLDFKKIPISQLNEIYNFILACREERGHSLSMTYEQLNKTVRKMKSNFVLFGVYKENNLVAASISIRVNKSVLYNFYSAHSKSTDSLSPIVFLIGEIYDWCTKHRFTILDLGTSAWGGKPNFPLIDFKLRLGAQPTMKLTFEKKLK